jgi:alpha-1,2-mannosyltransferase
VLLTGPRRAWRALGMAALAASLAAYAGDLLAHPRPAMLSWFDLHVYTAAGQHALSSPATLYSWQLRPGIRFTYTPFAALVFAGWAQLPWWLLAWLITAASAAALGLACWLTLGALGWQGRRRVTVALLVTAVSLWTEPVQRALHLGQVELLLMVLVVWDLCQPAHRWWKGAGIGVAAGIKLVPLIFLPYLLLTRRFRQAAVAAAAFAALAAAGFAVLPGASVQWWFGPDFLRATRTGFLGFLANQSMLGMITRLAGGDAAGTWWWLAAAAAVAVAGLLAAARLDRAGLPVAGWLLCALTGLLVSPVSWDHHWVWVVPALAVLASAALRAPRAARWRKRACWAAAALLAGAFGAWPAALWSPRAPLMPWGIIWSAGASPVGARGRPWASEYHWHGLAWLAGNLYVLTGLAGLAVGAAAAWPAAARCVATTYRGSRAEATPARSTANFATSPPPASSAALTAAAVRLRRASAAQQPPVTVMARAARSSRPPSPTR